MAADYLTDFGLDANDLRSLIADYNGDLAFKTDEAQVGYIKPEEYLILPVNTKDSEKSKDYGIFNNWVSPLGSDEARAKDGINLSLIITALNMDALGGGADSLPYAYVRAKMVVKGKLLPFVADAAGGRHVYTDEVRACTVAEYKAIDGAKKALVKAFYKSEERKFIDKHWRIFAAMLGHVLAVRGHHFRDAKVATADAEASESYTELYKRLWRASAIEADFPFKDMKKFFRTALHPFGLKVFTDILENGVNDGNLPRTFTIRADAVPAGSAKIGTGAAALRMMRAATWYKRFRERFETEIQLIFDAESEIKQDRLKFHVSPKLFGSPGPNNNEQKMIEEAVNAVSAIAPYIVAYISVECDGSPIALQKTLNNPANDQMGLMNRFKRFLEHVNKAADETSDISDLIPQIAGPAPVPAPGGPNP